MSSGRASVSTRLKFGCASPSAVTAYGVPTWTPAAPSASASRTRSGELMPPATISGIGAMRSSSNRAAAAWRNRAHHVDGDHAAARGNVARGADFAVERGEVGRLDRLPVARTAGGAAQVGVAAAQVYAPDRAGVGFPWPR